MALVVDSQARMQPVRSQIVQRTIAQKKVGIPRVAVKRTGIVLKPNNSRVLFRPFEPADQERVLKIIGA